MDVLISRSPWMTYTEVLMSREAMDGRSDWARANHTYVNEHCERDI